MYIYNIYICIYIYIIVSFHDHIVGSHPDPSSLVRQRCNSRLVVAKSDGRFAKSSPRFPGKPWKIRGKPMGFNMGTPWQSHGKPMENPWQSHGFSYAARPASRQRFSTRRLRRSGRTARRPSDVRTTQGMESLDS